MNSPISPTPPTGELLKITGEMCFVGNANRHEVEPLIEKPSLMLLRPDGSAVLLVGMTREECQAGAQALMGQASFTVSAHEVGGAALSAQVQSVPASAVPDHTSCALDYYRSAVERRAPKWVPARVRLASGVRGDFPLSHGTVAHAGEHDCEANQWGAVSVLAADGQRLGLVPAEFDPIAWRVNE